MATANAGEEEGWGLVCGSGLPLFEVGLFMTALLAQGFCFGEFFRLLILLYDFDLIFVADGDKLSLFFEEGEEVPAMSAN